MFTIYKITNNITNKFYIGFTTKLPARYRFSSHVSSMKRGSNLPLHNSMRKHGIKNFSFNIMEAGDNHEYGYKIAEPTYISWLKPEYNLTAGGDGITGHKHSEETKRKIGMAQIGKKQTQETKDRRSQALKGRPLSCESKAKLCGPRKQIECSNCHMVGGISNLKRYHFDNCKKKVMV